jgi:glutamyl-Q tRNA(Asp) synthetase
VSGARSSSATATTGTADGRYRGRFAPTPSGPLHFGSLVAAAGSYLDARARGGEWLVRIEDLDPPREKPGAADSILKALELFALEWDGPVVRQSERYALYEMALESLRARGSTRPCECSRTELKALAVNRSRPPGEELFHPETCLASPVERRRPAATRFRVPPGPVEFLDASLGHQACDVAQEVGDFVLRRRDGYIAYQLAVVVDDADQGITDVVRGADLLSSTARQILVQRALGLPSPTYLHLPLAVRADGAKLSKSMDAPEIARSPPAAQAWQALALLRQRPPAELEGAAPREIWQWGVAHWNPDMFAGVRSHDVGPVRLHRSGAAGPTAHARGRTS